MATDPYGTDLLLTNDGDFAVTPAGQLGVIDGPLNCAQALISRLRVYPGELPLQPAYGSALPPLVLGVKGADPTVIVSRVNGELRRIFESDRRFLKAQNIRSTVDPFDRTRIGVGIEIVLAGGDRLATTDVTGTPPLDAFVTAPALADSPEALDDLGLSDPFDDDLLELSDALEGLNDFEITSEASSG